MCYIVKGVDNLQVPPDINSTRLASAVDRYGNTLLRVALNLLGSKEDAEDAVQDTYLQYLRYAPEFREDEHEKAWLLRVCINLCKNTQRNRGRRDYTALDSVVNLIPTTEDDDREILRAVMSLPEKYRIAIYLYYMEGMSGRELAETLGISEAAVRKRLQKGRELLRLELT